MAMAMSAAPERRRTSFLRRATTRQAMLVWCFLAPSLLIFLLYRILPLAWNIILSFQAWSPLKPAVFIGLENYEEMLTDEVFWQSLWNTVFIILSCVFIFIVEDFADNDSAISEHPGPDHDLCSCFNASLLASSGIQCNSICSIDSVTVQRRRAERNRVCHSNRSAGWQRIRDHPFQFSRVLRIGQWHTLTAPTIHSKDKRNR